MTRAWNRLTANFVRGASKRGRYADGGGLYLQIADAAAPRHGCSCSRATAQAAPWGLARRASIPGSWRANWRRTHVRNWRAVIDPVDARRSAALEQRAARARLTTFQAVYGTVSRGERGALDQSKSIATNGIPAVRRYAFPVLGPYRSPSSTAAHVHKVLAPLATAKADHSRTATRPYRERVGLRKGSRTAHGREPRRQNYHQPFAAAAI